MDFKYHKEFGEWDADRYAVRVNEAGLFWPIYKVNGVTNESLGCFSILKDAFVACEEHAKEQGPPELRFHKDRAGRLSFAGEVGIGSSLTIDAWCNACLDRAIAAATADVTSRLHSALQLAADRQARIVELEKETSERVTQRVEWVSVKDTAHRLGITERSVMRRIASGRLRSRLTDEGNRQIAFACPVAMGGV